MASKNIDRTAIVKLGLVGTTSKTVSELDLSKDLHNFSYELVSDRGDTSYKFTIEVVNSNEKFQKSIVAAFQRAMRQHNGVISEDDVVKSFPKLLIQFGYPDSLSDIHTAQVSNVQYKFTHGKEKILVIEAVNISDWGKQVFDANVTSKISTAITSKRYDFKISPSIPISKSRLTMDVAKIITSLASQMLVKINGTRCDIKVLEDAINTDCLQVIRHFFNSKRTGSSIWTSGILPGEALEHSSDRGRTLDKSNTKIVENDFTANDDRRWYFALKRFFWILGIQLNNVPSAKYNDYSKFYPIRHSVIKEDTATYGEYTDFIPYNQLKNHEKVSNYEAPAAQKVKDDIIVNFDYTASLEISTKLDREISYYNYLVDGRGGFNTNAEKVSSAGAFIRAKISSYAGDKIRNGETYRVEILDHYAFTNDLRMKRITDPAVKRYELNVNAGLPVQGTGQTLGGYIQSLDYELTKAKSDEQLEEVFTDEQLNKYEASSIGEPIRYSELHPQFKHELNYGTLVASLHSPEGESVIDTIRGVFAKVNKIVKGSGSRIYLKEDTVSEQADFEERLALYSERPDNAVIARFEIGSEGAEETKTLPNLKQIESFPRINSDIASGVVNMSYGQADSIVKYFDFNGDVTYLANLLKSVATQTSLENTYAHLRNDALRLKVYPILAILLEDEEFLEKLKEDKEDNYEQIISDLEALKTQLLLTSEDKGIEIEVQGISHNFLNNVGYIDAYLADTDVRQRLVGDMGLDEFQDNYTTTERFFKALLSNEGIASLFKVSDKVYKEGKLVSPVSRALNIGLEEETIEEDEETLEAVYYVLRGNNIYSDYAGMTETDKIIAKTNQATHLLNLDQWVQNHTFAFELKMKTLGIPEMDTLDEISSPRIFNFKVHDLSRENSKDIEDDTTPMHWLTGLYRPTAINHTINNSVGYTSEFKLLKDMSLI